MLQMWQRNVIDVCNNDDAQKDLKYWDINEELVSLDFSNINWHVMGRELKSDVQNSSCGIMEWFDNNSLMFSFMIDIIIEKSNI